MKLENEPAVQSNNALSLEKLINEPMYLPEIEAQSRNSKKPEKTNRK
jgi:hypothetical protein